MIYRFAPYSLDISTYELRRGEEVLPIPPKVFSLLEYMLKNADRAIPKEELLDEVWADVIVGDAALAQAVSQARRAMGEPEGSEIIQTVRGRGYRVGVEVRIEDAVAQVAAGPSETRASEMPVVDEATALPPRPEADSAPAVASSVSRSRRPIAIVAAGVVFLAVFLWLGSARLEPPERRLPVASGSSPLTSIAVLPFSDMSTGGGE